MTELEELDLYDNRIRMISNISHLTKLKQLDLSFNNFKKIEGIETLDKIEQLFFVSNRITNVVLLDLSDRKPSEQACFEDARAFS
jgi:Leucine-rich repeat (LRR) protein